MKVRERIDRRSEFKSDLFWINDPDFGRIRARVSDFIGLRNDGEQGIRDDHPAMEFEVAQEEV